MATPNETIKYCLFHYPTLYKNPIDVLMSVFLGISTHEWKKGEVDHTEFEKDYKGKMRYDSQFISQKEDMVCLKSLNVARAMKEHVELNRMMYVEENIDKILLAHHTETYFGSEPYGMRIVKDMWHVTYEEDQSLKLPKNLSKEWAIELCEFVRYILVRFNCAYQVGDSRDMEENVKHWPEDAKRARKVLLKAEKQFYPIAYGMTKEQSDERAHRIMTEMLDDLSDDIKKDELDAK